MKTYYKAAFPDGTVVTRSTDGRQYSHAWAVRWHYQGDQNSGDGMDYGFSGSEELARKGERQRATQVNQWTTYTVFFSGTAPVEEITRDVYTALRAK